MVSKAAGPRPADTVVDRRSGRIGAAGVGAAALARSASRAGSAFLAGEPSGSVRGTPTTTAVGSDEPAAEERVADAAARLATTLPDTSRALDVGEVVFRAAGRPPGVPGRRLDRIFARAEAVTRAELGRLAERNPALARALQLSRRQVAEARFALDLVLDERPDDQAAVELGSRAAQLLARRAEEMLLLSPPTAPIGGVRLQRQAEGGHGSGGTEATAESQRQIPLRHYPEGVTLDELAALVRAGFYLDESQVYNADRYDLEGHLAAIRGTRLGGAQQLMFSLSELRSRGAEAEEMLACIREASPDAAASVAADAEARGWLREALPNDRDYWLARFLLRYGRESSFYDGLEDLIRLAGEPAVPARSVVWSLVGLSTSIGVAEAGREQADRMRPFQTDVLVNEMLRDRFGREGYSLVRRSLDTGLLGETQTGYVYQVRQLGNPSEVYEAEHPGAGPLPASKWPAGWRWQPVVRTGRAAYDLDLLRDRANVLVRIKFVWHPIAEGPPRSTSTDSRTFGEAKQEALHAIRSSWDGSFWLDSGMLRIPIRVQIEESESDPHHTVDVWSGQVPPDSTPDVKNWYADDSRGITLGFTAVHEFGHFLGNVDEQNLSAEEYERVVGSAPSATNPRVTVSESDRAAGYRYTARGSVMGFTYRELSLQQVGEAQAAPVLARHFRGVQATANAILPPGVDRFEVVGSPPS